jgi:hypothetical protein
MTKILKFLLSEPLVHFLLLGALLYAFYDLKSKDTVLISIEKKVQLQKERNESNTSVSFRTYEQVLLQEAYRLGLEKQDSYISQRLIKQMEFILQGSQNFVEPSEETLYKFYKENIKEYSEIKILSFHYLSFDANQSKLLKKSQRILATVNPSTCTNCVYLKNQSEESLTKLFGNYFTRILFTQFSKEWSKSIPSNGKNYLVYVDKKEVLKPFAFNEVEGRVYRDYKAFFMKNVREEAFKKLLKSYKVEIK